MHLNSEIDQPRQVASETMFIICIHLVSYFPIMECNFCVSNHSEFRMLPRPQDQTRWCTQGAETPRRTHEGQGAKAKEAKTPRKPLR